MKRIKTVIKDGEVEMEFFGFAGQSCVKERKQLAMLLSLLGLDNEVQQRIEKEEVEEHVRTKFPHKTSQG